jgi:hypothetical protein
MSAETKKVRACDECGATIPRDDFLSHAAARYKGKLLCAKCVQDVKNQLAAQRKPEGGAGGQKPPMEELELIKLPFSYVEEEEDNKPRVVGGPSTQIHGASAAPTFLQKERAYKRPLIKDAAVATRCRTFHCKLSDASFGNLNDQINEWTDENAEVEIKFAISNIGVVEGKHADPHLIVTIFY